MTSAKAARGKQTQCGLTTVPGSKFRMAGGNLAPRGLGSGESSHCSAAPQALCPEGRICLSGPGVLGSAHCWWGGRGEQTLPLGGWRWHSQGLAGKVGDHQPKPSPEEPFGINLLKVEEGSSPHPLFGDPMSEASRCSLNAVTAGCDLWPGHKDPSSFSARLLPLPSFHDSRLSFACHEQHS